MRDSESKGVVVIIALALMVPLMIANGVVLMFLWRWFVSPITDLPELHIAQAIGVSMVVSFLTHQHISSDTDANDLIGGIAYAITKPIFALGIGFIISLFI